ncbi:MAG: hypothetical protein ACP5E4_02400 [Candidatus Aenigmatarchaeota archaeon]
MAKNEAGALVYPVVDDGKFREAPLTEGVQYRIERLGENRGLALERLSEAALQEEATDTDLETILYDAQRMSGNIEAAKKDRGLIEEINKRAESKMENPGMASNVYGRVKSVIDRI